MYKISLYLHPTKSQDIKVQTDHLIVVKYALCKTA